jgi:hypothetical protein
MKSFYSFILIALTFFGCKKDSQTAIDYAYIGGEIINPSSNYVVLSKDETIIDTIRLDGKNRFLYKVKKINAGIHTFKHGLEYQMIFLEPKDSVLFRLNTLDFDESLVFSGHGDKKNNYLINDYLENEKDEKYILKLCQLSPKRYLKNIDSIKDRKVKNLAFFIDKYEPSDLFQKIAQANINYSYYSNKEVYPFIHYGKDKTSILNTLPEDFYDFRKEVNYNDEFLSSYNNYMTFLRHSFSNISLKIHDEHDKGMPYNKQSLCYNLDKLQLIDSLVTNITIKDDLLYHFTMHYVSRSKSEKNNNTILKYYLSKTKNEKGKEHLVRYTNSLNRLKVGSKIPEIVLINFENKEINLNRVINQPTVISFWSNIYFDHFKESHYRINELMEKYPEVEFVSINIDGINMDQLTKTLLVNKFESKNEFVFKNPQKASEELALYPMNKTIILDKDKEIVNNNINIFSIYFEKQLLGLINK